MLPPVTVFALLLFSFTAKVISLHNAFGTGVPIKSIDQVKQEARAAYDERRSVHNEFCESQTPEAATVSDTHASTQGISLMKCRLRWLARRGMTWSITLKSYNSLAALGPRYKVS